MSGSFFSVERNFEVNNSFCPLSLGSLVGSVCCEPVISHERASSFEYNIILRERDYYIIALLKVRKKYKLLGHLILEISLVSNVIITTKFLPQI